MLFSLGCSWELEIVGALEIFVKHLNKTRGDDFAGCQLIDKAWDSFHDVKLKDRGLIWYFSLMNCLVEKVLVYMPFHRLAFYQFLL